MSALSEQSR